MILDARGDQAVVSRAGSLPVLLAVAVLISIWIGNSFGEISDLAALLAAVVVSVGALYLFLRTGWLEPKLSGRILRLGSPVVLAMLSQTAVNVVDTAFVGRLPADVALPGVAAIG